MNRSSIIALGILAAILAYFLSFGAETRAGSRLGFIRWSRPSSRRGPASRNQSPRQHGLKTLDEVERVLTEVIDFWMPDPVLRKGETSE